MTAPQAPPSLEVHHTLAHIPLRVTGATGLLGSLCVLIGVAQSRSPFVSKLPDAWLFGMSGADSHASKDGVFLSILVVYVGVVLMIISWFELVRSLRRNPATPTRRVVTILAAWVIPVLAMPPLFSRDVYSYAAQGEMVSRGFNPYRLRPTVLGRDPYLHLVDPIWRNAHAPYGPAWERLAGGIVQLGRHDVVATIVGFRLVAVIGVGLISWGIFSLARSVERDPAVALGLAVLNPLVLLVLLGGAHNDALMLGLLVAGCAAARRNHVVIGLLLCALAAEVKIPALLGALVIGWWWSEDAASWRHRVPRATGALLIALILMVVISLISGLGWRWVDGLSDPGVVVSWADPVTAVGLSLSHLSHALGFGPHTTAFVQATRTVGLALAAVISMSFVVRSGRIGELQALGWSLLISVALGPVIWPWYETWGFVFLGVIAEGWTLRVLLAFSAIACFADLPSLHFFDTTNPVLPIVSWTVLVGLVVAYAEVRLVPSIPQLVRPSSTSLRQ